MTYTRLEAAKHRKWFIYSSRRYCWVTFFFFFFSCAVSFCSSEHVFLSACVHTHRLWQATTTTTLKKTHIQPTHHHRHLHDHHTISTVLLVVFVLVLITINYLIISLYMDHFILDFLKHPWQASRTWVSDFFSFLCNSLFFPSFFQCQCNRYGKFCRIAMPTSKLKNW